MRSTLRWSVLLLVISMLFPVTVSAMQPYDTFYISSGTGGADTRIYWMQDVYTLAETSALSGEQALNKPSDLFVAGNDHVFIADKGNNRIIETDEQGAWVRTIGGKEGKGMLRAPEGVAVAADGTVYVADTGNQRVAVFDGKGTFLREYGKPGGDLLPAEYFFVPVKLAVDARGVMYVVSKGSYQGILRMNPEGGFTGFFGGNKTKAGAMDWLKRKMFTKEQMAKEELKRPPEIGSVTIDGDGFIYTSTPGTMQDQIKKLNAGGVNRFSGLKTLTKTESDQIADVAVDARGFFYVLDRKQERFDGMITLYGPGGTALFKFGKSRKDPQQRGVFSYPAAIGIDSRNRLWVLDTDLNLMQAFDRTPLGNAVLNAAADYYEGDYTTSKANWEQVRSLNELVNLTYLGLGEAARKEGHVGEAMAYFKMSYDNDGYSEVFWTYRRQWIQHYFAYVVAGLLALWLLHRFFIKPQLRRIRIPLPVAIRRIGSELADGWYTLFHPFEGFYRMKGRRISVVSLGIVLLLVLAGRLLSLYGTGFIFHPVDLNAIRPGRELALFFAPFATWIVANYLVSTVKDGEGRFRDVLQASIFAMVPYVVLTGPIVVLTHILVLEEGILVSSLTSIMWLWMIVLFLVGSQVIHNFEFVENIRNSVITVLTVGLIWIFFIVSAGLTYNVTDFIYQLYKEVAVLG
ncbi:YIP1 family protein [Paenibacillus nasutitermitis]|uniref:Yip1 domain-containing protein n=1 Tax=Paenibacillus nasutitermitis TaxID=1652958 RepID=A0A916YLB5_9BACL|nr:YIP1 family protein [Paenibacillus nasutitermitis]GGD51303.1 hypothetical protein GCM10010911_06090 [Paenibacillus nasutitermitis]